MLQHGLGQMSETREIIEKEKFINDFVDVVLGRLVSERLNFGDRLCSIVGILKTEQQNNNSKHLMVCDFCEIYTNQLNDNRI